MDMKFEYLVELVGKHNTPNVPIRYHTIRISASNAKEVIEKALTYITRFNFEEKEVAGERKWDLHSIKVDKRATLYQLQRATPSVSGSLHITAEPLHF